jgi:hypothetical protein
VTDAQFASFQRLQVSLLRGRLVLNVALRSPQLKEVPSKQWGGKEPVVWLEEHLRLDFADGPEIPRRSYGSAWTATTTRRSRRS